MAAPSKIIVTGAAQGLGRAVALRLAAPGHHVAVWDTKIDGAEETARLCRERGAVARAWTVDVGAEDQVEGAVADFVREWGLPDSLVANAGIFPRSRALDMQLSEWDRVLRVNLTGTFLCARAAARCDDPGRRRRHRHHGLGARARWSRERRPLFRHQRRDHLAYQIAGARLGARMAYG